MDFQMSVVAIEFLGRRLHHQLSLSRINPQAPEQGTGESRGEREGNFRFRISPTCEWTNQQLRPRVSEDPDCLHLSAAILRDSGVSRGVRKDVPLLLLDCGLRSSGKKAFQKISMQRALLCAPTLSVS